MGPVEITKTDDGVLLVQNFDPVALRERPMIPKKVHLKLGETAQFIREHRVIGDGNVWNERQVVNVALLERFDSEVFRLRPFDYERHFRSRLVR